MAVRVQVPASTANLGPAFDCAAIALNLYLRVYAEPRSAPGFEIAYRGVDANRVPAGEENLVVQAIRSYAASAKTPIAGARIEIENDIPIGVGLGSSAAAIIAGFLIAAELVGGKPERALLLREAAALEHHPDNVTAALCGGFVVAATAGGESAGSGEVLFHRCDVSESLDFIAVTPDRPLPTEKARSVLPAQYSRQDVVQNLQRVALLTAAFCSGSGLTPEIFRDRIHQPYRSPLIPGIADCLEFRHEGLGGVFISGAGSSVMAIATKHATEIGDALVEKFNRNGVKARATHLKADNRGAQILK
ncbi:MAG: homoserine kinase [Candidatus Acidiferrales bacterium]